MSVGSWRQAAAPARAAPARALSSSAPTDGAHDMPATYAEYSNEVLLMLASHGEHAARRRDARARL